jgi:hypothetical protein
MNEISTKKINSHIIPDHRWYYQNKETRKIAEIQIYSLGVNDHCEVIVHFVPRKSPFGDLTLSLEEFHKQFTLYNP